MKSNMISGRVIEIEPDAQYQGSIYTQTVTVKISNNLIELFDGTVPVVSKEHLNEDVWLQIKAQVKSLEKIEQEDVHEIRKSGDDFEITGEVTEIEKNDQQLVLLVDVGDGTIELEVSKNMNILLDNLSIGDTILIESYRLDLIDIN